MQKIRKAHNILFQETLIHERLSSDGSSPI